MDKFSVPKMDSKQKITAASGSAMTPANGYPKKQKPWISPGTIRKIIPYRKAKALRFIRSAF